MRRATRDDRQYMEAVAALGCVVCRNQGQGHQPAQVHHIRQAAGMGQRSPHTLTIPLCPEHHQTGGHGVAIHAGQRTWENLYGSELGLLAQTILDLWKATRSWTP